MESEVVDYLINYFFGALFIVSKEQKKEAHIFGFEYKYNRRREFEIDMKEQFLEAIEEFE